ncbi:MULTISPECIES: hypothetical protein [Asticcacaulis]|uniref:hypothetical protein n=1 Tax=Asticcacaulis TaxID=76890 RepID=UPI001AEA3D36|nr:MULTISPECIES: hypothetical protein [Asticcacaulis]MBP2159369.1 hypothetical protein [Asticcacaulis solisilvae]MDR6800414.1 hypothetical protein [Asticcacaulis sp. BE141]
MSSFAHSQVHYEVFARKTPSSSWALQMALENRDLAIKSAETLLVEKSFAAVMVSKETLDNNSGEYRSLTVFTKGAPEQKTKVKTVASVDSVCTAPQDLYTAVAREKISRLLEEWLKRNAVTPFELLHRPDLAERLEATGTELQHVVQKLAVPESQDTGQDLHELMRRWRALIDKAVTRLITDGRKKTFPDVVPSNWLGTIDKLSGHPEKAYILGGALAKVLGEDRRPAVKLEKLLLFATVLADNLDGREWAMHVIEAPVVEIFASRSSLSDVLGEEADLGTSLAIMTRMAAGREVDLVAKVDPQIARIIPPLKDVLEGYHNLILRDCLKTLAANISKRLMLELKGPRRLKPGDPEGEIEILRALAMCMTAAGKEESQRDDVKEAFTERSKMLVSSDFVASLTQNANTASEEIDKLIWLCENVAGAANKRQAARWLASAITSLKFEREIRNSNTPAPQRLQQLAQMQKKVLKAALSDADRDEIMAKLGHIGGQIAGDIHLIQQTLKAPVSPMNKLAMLLNFAAGNGAPLGPVSDQAKAEVMRLLRIPQIRDSLMGNPQALAALKPMMQAAGLAA